MSLLFLTHVAYSAQTGEIKPEIVSWRALNLTASELVWLEKKSQLKLGIDRSFSPYEWIDDDAKYTGICADYIQILERRLGIPIVPVTDINSWSEVLQIAKKGEFDLMSCLVRTKEREEYLNFSPSYVSSTAVIISEQASGYIGTLDKLQGKVVAIHEGHFTNDLLRRDYPQINIVNTPSIQKALNLVAEGKVDAFVGDATAAGFVMKQEGILNLNFSGHTDYQSKFSFAIPRNNPILLGIVNKALASITKTERDAIFDHWRGLKMPQGIALEKILVGLAFFIVLLICFTYWNYQLRQSKEAHKLSERRFKNLVAATDGVVWEADIASGTFTYISDNSVRIFGYSLKDWMSTGFWISHIHPQDRQAAIAFRQGRSEILSTHEFEYRFITEKNEVVWIRDMVSSVAENKLSSLHRGLMLDITDQKKSELLIKQSEYRFRELIESLPAIAVQGYDEQLRIIYWNDASTVLYGYTPEEAQGKRLHDLIIPAHIREESIRKLQDWFLNGIDIASSELELQHKDGSIVPVYSSHVMLSSGTNNKELFCIDISLVEQKKAHAELNYIAHIDPLTLLPNRRTFSDRLSQVMKKVDRNGGKLAVMMIDLDYFKEVNDTLGHAYGDLLLQETAQRLLSCVRETDTVARLGGDEFLVIIENALDILITERVAENILKQLSEPFIFNDNRSHISASIGIALYPSDASCESQLLKNADHAMYVAKKEGRNCFYYFTAQMEQFAKNRRAMLNELRDSIELNQLEVYYQPIVDLNNGDVIKAEALLRWNHPDGQISPLDFIPLAEESGQIIDIGNWLFSEVTRQSAQWKLQVCVKASSLQFHDDNFCNHELFNSISDTELELPRVCIEITKDLLVKPKQEVFEKIITLRDKGIEISLDDFGTGNSSLTYLNKFDIDYLKINKSFVSNLGPSNQEKMICEAIIVMAHTLGIKVIAKGVETKLQHELLKAIGCDFAEGYFYDQPLPAGEFASQWLTPESMQTQKSI
ncbi:MAG: EAL domain-containing protein [Oceanospirillaceae bacterium]